MDGSAGVAAGTSVEVPPAPPTDEAAGVATEAAVADAGQEALVVQQEETVSAPMETDALVGNEALEPSAPASSDLLG